MSQCSLPPTPGLRPHPASFPATLCPQGRVAMVTLLLTVSRETAPWSWSYLQDLPKLALETGKVPERIKGGGWD